MPQVETKTLYFIADSSPTSDDETRAAKIPGIVRFRNAEEAAADADFELSDQVTAAPGVTIPAAYAAVPRVSPEKPLSLEIVPDAPSIDLSNAEGIRLRAIARFRDGSATDVTALCAWISGTEAKATVGAATGIVTPVEAGATIITATYNWAAPGEEGVVYAAKLFTFTGVGVADETVVAGGTTYTIKAEPADTASATAVQVKTATTAALQAKYLAAAINREKQGLKNGWYSSDAVENPNVRAVLDGATVNVIAKAPGTTGNAIAISETTTNGSFAGGATALSGGVNATAAIADTATVTVVA